MTLRPCVLIGRRSGSADGRGQGQRQRAQMDQPQRIGRSWCRAATGTERGKGREPWWVQWVLVGTDELGAREVRCVGCSSNMSSVRRCQGREGCEGCECCTGGAGKCVCVVAGCRGTFERGKWSSAVRTLGTATLLYTHPSTVYCVVDNWPVAADYNTKGTVGKVLAVCTPFGASTTYDCGRDSYPGVFCVCSRCVPNSSGTHENGVGRTSGVSAVGFGAVKCAMALRGEIGESGKAG